MKSTRMISDNVTQWKRAADGLRNSYPDRCKNLTLRRVPYGERGGFVWLCSI